MVDILWRLQISRFFKKSVILPIHSKTTISAVGKGSSLNKNLLHKNTKFELLLSLYNVLDLSFELDVNYSCKHFT